MKKISLISILLWFFTTTLQAQGIQVSGILTSPACFGGNNGSISLTVTGGQSPYLFNWSIGSTSQNISGLSAGVYSVSVSDAIGGLVIEIYTLSDPSLLSGSVTSVIPISCFGNNDGAISALVNGGTPPYTYQWSNGVNLPDLNGLSSDTYTLTISDANGCQESLSVFVDQPTPIVLDFRVYSCESAVGNNAQVTINATGGSPPYTYSWSDGSVTANAFRNDLSYGGYDVTVEDASNCVVEIENIYVCHDDMALPTDFILCQFDQATLSTFAPGATAYSWSPATALSCTNCPDPVATPTTTTTYTVTITSPGLSDFVHELTITIDENCIWPGDIDSSGNVSHFDLLPIGLSFDTIGPIRYKASFDWMGQTALPWGGVIPGTTIDLRHVDADGDGIIGEADADPLLQNWEQELAFSNEVSPYPDIPLIDTLPFYIEVDTFSEGQTLHLPVILGIDDLPGEDIYGIAFSIDYDSSLFVAGTALMTFDSSWLGTEGVDMITVQKEFSLPGRLDVAMVRTDGDNISGIGSIGHYIIVVEDDILFHDPNGQSNFLDAIGLETLFNISNVRLINKDGFQMTPFTPAQTGILVDQRTAIEEVFDLNQFIKFFPNPAQSELVLDAGNIKMKQYELYNSSGMLIEMRTIANENKMVADISHLPNGIYWLRVQTDLGLMAGKLIVLK